MYQNKLISGSILCRGLLQHWDSVATLARYQESNAGRFLKTGACKQGRFWSCVKPGILLNANITVEPGITALLVTSLRYLRVMQTDKYNKVQLTWHKYMSYNTAGRAGYEVTNIYTNRFKDLTINIMFALILQNKQNRVIPFSHWNIVKLLFQGPRSNKLVSVINMDINHLTMRPFLLNKADLKTMSEPTWKNIIQSNITPGLVYSFSSALSRFIFLFLLTFIFHRMYIMYTPHLYIMYKMNLLLSLQSYH